MTANDIKAACPRVKSSAAPVGLMVNGHRVVLVKTARNEYRLGEMGGDWIMHGTADEIAGRLIPSGCRGRDQGPQTLSER